MDHGDEGGTAFIERMARVDILAGFERALDAAYAHTRRAAQIQWRKIFANSRDASDAIVGIRTAAKSEPQPGSAFLPTRKRPTRAAIRSCSDPRLVD